MDENPPRALERAHRSGESEECMPDLLYEVQGHLARITMNRPEHLNCFSEEMIHLWTAALEDIRDRDDIYAVLLSGNGKAFCAGAT